MEVRCTGWDSRAGGGHKDVAVTSLGGERNTGHFLWTSGGRQPPSDRCLFALTAVSPVLVRFPFLPEIRRKPSQAQT